MAASLEYIFCYQDERESFMESVVTVDGNGFASSSYSQKKDNDAPEKLHGCIE
jgi:hypothetical protein